MTVTLHGGDRTRFRRPPGWSAVEHLKFTIAFDQVGVLVLGFFLDNEQIPESPLRVLAVDRDEPMRVITNLTQMVHVYGLELQLQSGTPVFFSVSSSPSSLVFLFVAFSISAYLYIQKKLAHISWLRKEASKREFHLCEPDEVAEVEAGCTAGRVEVTSKGTASG